MNISISCGAADAVTISTLQFYKKLIEDKIAALISKSPREDFQNGEIGTDLLTLASLKTVLRYLGAE